MNTESRKFVWRTFEEEPLFQKLEAEEVRKLPPGIHFASAGPDFLLMRVIKQNEAVIYFLLPKKNAQGIPGILEQVRGIYNELYQNNDYPGPYGLEQFYFDDRGLKDFLENEEWESLRGTLGAVLRRLKKEAHMASGLMEALYTETQVEES